MKLESKTIEVKLTKNFQSVGISETYSEINEDELKYRYNRMVEEARTKLKGLLL